MTPFTITNVEPAHNTIKVFCPKSTVRVSIPPACRNKRLNVCVEERCLFAENERNRFAVGCIISLKKRTGVHSSLVVPLHNNNNSIHAGKQITAGQLTE